MGKTGRIRTSQTKSWKTTARFKVGALTAEMAVQKERKREKKKSFKIIVGDLHLSPRTVIEGQVKERVR